MKKYNVSARKTMVFDIKLLETIAIKSTMCKKCQLRPTEKTETKKVFDNLIKPYEL